MAKTLRISPHVSFQVGKLLEAKEFAYGLVLGQFAALEKEFFVVHLARTPAEEQEDIHTSGAIPPPNVER